MARPIVFLSDYGLEDEYAGVCRGVMAGIAPDAPVVDLTHAVPAHDVLRGALVLAASARFMPERAVFLAVVDPGVGTVRRALAVETASGATLVGPDNGLLAPAWEQLGGAARAVEITSERVLLHPVSPTFHGRDVFAPAAAHLAAGVAPAELGPAVDPAGLVRLTPLASRVEGGQLHGAVLLVDHFGNLSLNLSREELDRVGVGIGDPVEVHIGGQTYRLPFEETFSSVPAGRLVLHEDSFRSLAVAVNQGRAAERLNARSGDPVVVARVTA